MRRLTCLLAIFALLASLLLAFLPTAHAETAASGPDRFEATRIAVYDQGREGTCWYWATAEATALRLVNLGQAEPRWTDGVTPKIDWNGHSFDVLTVQGAKHTLAFGGSLPMDPTSIRTALQESGSLLIASSLPNSLAVFHSRALPVIHPRADDADTGGHSLLAVGYRPDGLIVQNSWGDAYGFHGRAVLGWDWVRAFVKDVEKYDVDGTGLDAAPASYAASPQDDGAPNPLYR